MKNIFKILILILVGVSVTSCELLNWDDANRYREERGIEKKEVENVIELVVDIFIVKIQNNLKKKNSSLIKLEFFFINQVHLSLCTALLFSQQEILQL